MKKGQVSLFIILALIIIFVIIFLMINSSYTPYSFQERIDPVIQPIYDQYRGCIKDSGRLAIYAIEHNGGYATSANFSNDFGIAYYYYLGENHMPSKEIIEKELNEFIEYSISQNCFINDYLIFDFDSITNTGEVKAESTIGENYVVFDVEFPVEIKKGDNVYDFKDFKKISVPSKLNLLYDSAYEIIQDQMNYEGICINCINNISFEKGVYTEISDINEDTLFIIQYIDEQNLTEEYHFSNKYNKKAPLFVTI